jgi:hypothetical protein
MPDAPDNNAALEAFGWINSAINNLAESIHAVRQSGALTEHEDAGIQTALAAAAPPLADLEREIAMIRQRLMS